MNRTQLNVQRCRDPEVIDRFLAVDYFDYPVCLFTPRMRLAASRWLAQSESVYFMSLESAGQPAGFVFAHTLGFRLWREFAWQHPFLAPHALWVFTKLRLFPRWAYPRSRFSHARPHVACSEVAQLGLSRIDEPFRWDEPDSRTGFVDLLFVSPAFRGQDFGPLLLRALVAEMQGHGVRRLQAHVDPGNYPSARAFLKGGWTVVETATNDMLASIDCPGEAIPQSGMPQAAAG